MATSKPHRQASLGNMHAPHNWRVANEAALLALSVTSADVGKYAWQQDDDTEWMLLSTGPAVWQQRGAQGPAGADGVDGVTGATGATGPEGPPGSIGTVDTDDVTEASNLYFTEDRVRGTDLAGLDTTAGTPTSSDTLLGAIGKLVGKLVAHIGGSADKHPASDIVNTPAGSIVATNVQAALNELDTKKQPVNVNLTALAGLTSAASKGIQFTGSGTAGTYDLTTAGKALLDDADAAAQRATLGLGTLATQSGTFSGTSSNINTGDETAARIAALGHAASSKTTPVDADEIFGADSAASFGLVRYTFTNIKAFLKTYFDTLYATVGSGGTTVSPLSYGCAGNGSTDDTTNFQAAITAAAGKVIDGLGLTYKISSTLSLPSNTTLINCTLNGATMANGDTLIEAFGTLGSSVSMSAIASVMSSTVVVSSATGISANTILYLQSGTIFGYGATTNGELIKVRSLSGTTITPYRRVYDSYVSTPVFYKPTMLRNITLRNVHMIGGGNTLNHVGFHANLCENVVIDKCTSSNMGDRHFQALRCLNVTVVGCRMEHSDDATGLSYGIVIGNGCDNVTVSSCKGIDMRHGVTIGAENGVDRNIAITGNTFNGCTDSPIDTHPQAQFVSITGNVLEGNAILNSQDGLVMQGINYTLANNVVHGYSRVGILLQPLCVNNLHSDLSTCSGNTVLKSTGSTSASYALIYDNQAAGSGARIAITGNALSDITTNGNGILLELASTGGSVNGLTITGNQVYARQHGLRITSATLKLIRSVTIVGNTIESLANATYDVINISSTSSNHIERVLIAANNLFGGRYGIGSTNGSRIVSRNNMIQNFATAATNGVTDAVGDYTS